MPRGRRKKKRGRKKDPCGIVERLLVKMDLKRPETRADCKNVPRPCPFVGCRHNTFIDINSSSKRLKIIFNQCEDPSEMEISNCVLDIVEKHGPMTLEDVGTYMNVTRERVRQIGDAALRKTRIMEDV